MAIDSFPDGFSRETQRFELDRFHKDIAAFLLAHAQTEALVQDTLDEPQKGIAEEITEAAEHLSKEAVDRFLSEDRYSLEMLGMMVDFEHGQFITHGALAFEGTEKIGYIDAASTGLPLEPYEAEDIFLAIGMPAVLFRDYLPIDMDLEFKKAQDSYEIRIEPANYPGTLRPLLPTDNDPNLRWLVLDRASRILSTARLADG